MSKTDDMRAMREASYRAARPAAGKPTVVPKTQPRSHDRAESAETGAQPPRDELCGHRAISSRLCTRDKGHAAKSHRYS